MRLTFNAEPCSGTLRAVTAPVPKNRIENCRGPAT